VTGRGFTWRQALKEERALSAAQLAAVIGYLAGELAGRARGRAREAESLARHIRAAEQRVQPITEEQCDQFFEGDYTAALLAAHQYAWFDGLDEVRRRLIICLEFNMGPRVFGEFKGTQAAIQAGEFDEAVHNASAAGDFISA